MSRKVAWGRFAVVLGMVAFAAALLAIPGENPMVLFLLGWATGAVAVVGSWWLTRWVGCRRCNPEEWP